MPLISLSRDIEPLSKFREKSAEFIVRLKKDRQPIVLTQHGKGAAVLMDVREFERLTDRIALLEELLEAKQQAADGKTYTFEEAQRRIEAFSDKWK